MSKVLLITLAWPQEGMSNLYRDLMLEFVDNGNEVYVLTPQEKRFGVGKLKEKDNKINIFRVRSGNITKTNYIEKTISLFLLNFQFRIAQKDNFKNIRFDIIIQTTPSILLSNFSKYLKKTYNCFYYLMLRDMWPQGAVDHGIVKKYGLIWAYIRCNEKRTYRTADKIGCMSQDAVDFVLLQNQYLSKKKVEYCPNTIRKRPFPLINKTIIRKKYNIPVDNIIFMYGGNISASHNIIFIANCLNRISHNINITFVFAGSGTHFNNLKQMVHNNRIALFINQLDQSDYFNLLHSCDIGMILLSEKYSVPQFPSKFLDYIAFSKPMLSISAKNSSIGKIIESNNVGLNIGNNDYDEFLNAIIFLSNKNNIKPMIQNCNSLFLNNFTSKTTYNIINKSFINHVTKKN